MDQMEKKPTLLIIDDEEMICEVLSEMVLNMTKRVNVITATSAEEAVRLIPTVDMIIADIMMPNQYMLDEALRLVGVDKPIARMSGDAKGKANFMIEKPFRLDQIAQTIQFLYMMHRQNGSDPIGRMAA